MRVISVDFFSSMVYVILTQYTTCCVKIKIESGGERMKNEATLSEAAKAEQRKYKREYMRRWRAANKDKVAENNRRYWERKAEREAQANG